MRFSKKFPTEIVTEISFKLDLFKYRNISDYHTIERKITSYLKWKKEVFPTTAADENVDVYIRGEGGCVEFIIYRD